jgi:uncharacterized membrane protein
MYLSVVLSMTLPVSDVHIFDQSMRRIAWLLRMAAFFFNVIYIATPVSVVAGVL